MKRYLLLGAVVLTLAAIASPARAGFVDTLQSGTNSYEDISRESFFFANPSAGLSVGDVIVGFSQIQTRTNGPRTFDTIYVVFSQQVTAINPAGSPPNTVVFGATTASNPESLQSILPGAGIPAGTIATVFDRPQGSDFPLDLVNQAPAGATSINNYLQNIAANGTNEVSYGIVGGTDFLNAQATVPVSSITPTLLNATPNSVTLASFQGGLTLTQNNTAFKFGALVPVLNPVTGTITAHDLAIVRGSASGANNDANYNIFGPGVGDNASFVVDVTSVPEPSSILLLGIGLGGFAGRAFLRRKKALTA